MKGLMVAGVVCSVLSCLLILIGFATPGWIIIHVQSNIGEDIPGEMSSSQVSTSDILVVLYNVI